MRASERSHQFNGVGMLWAENKFLGSYNHSLFLFPFYAVQYFIAPSVEAVEPSSCIDEQSFWENKSEIDFPSRD